MEALKLILAILPLVGVVFMAGMLYMSHTSHGSDIKELKEKLANTNLLEHRISELEKLIEKLDHKLDILINK